MYKKKVVVFVKLFAYIKKVSRATIIKVSKPVTSIVIYNLLRRGGGKFDEQFEFFLRQHTQRMSIRMHVKTTFTHAFG